MPYAVNNQEVRFKQGWIASVILALSSSFLFIASFPPWNVGPLTGWFCLVPLIAAVDRASTTRAWWMGWLFGLAANGGVFYWLFVVPGIRWYHFALLGTYLAVYPGLWAIIASRFVRSSASAQVGIACAWILLEYIRGHAGFLGLPWITLAESQVENLPLLQTASVFGEPGITFIVALGNLAVWNLLTGAHRRFAWMGAMPVLGTILAGTTLLVLTESGSTLRLPVAALGTSFPVRHPPLLDPETRFQRQLEFLHRELPSNIGLVVMPESALVNPKLFPATAVQLKELAELRGTTLVIGVAESTKFDYPPDTRPVSPQKVRSGAWLASRGSDTPQYYQKSVLVPFSEEVPLRNWIPWPVWLIRPIHEVERGPAPKSYSIADGIRIGIMICWESLFAGHTRTLVNDDASVLVMLANEGWFGATAAGAQHNLTAIMRAAEANRSVVVASNMGPCLIIDPHGRVIAQSLAHSGMTLVLAEVPITTSHTLYSRFGDVFVAGCGMFMIVTIILMKIRDRRRP